MMTADWITSLSHLIFLSLIIYLWKSKSKFKARVASLLVLAGCLYGLHWIFISLNEYGGLNYFIASLATLLLASYVASYYLIAGIFIRKFDLGPLNIASIICLAEWTKSNFLTGFPWLNIGVLQIDSIFSILAPFLGAYGVGFVAVYFAASIVNSFKLTILLGITLSFAALFLNNFVNFVEPNGKELNVALVQGAISQKLKFDPIHQKNAQKTHVDLIKSATKKNSELELIVLPETALTTIFSNLEISFLNNLKKELLKNNTVLMTGIPQNIENDWKNSLIALKVEDFKNLRVYGSYDKHHLVPFGEFVPWGFKWFVNMMQIPLGEFRTGKNPQPPIKVRDQFIGVNICFEDLFGDEISSVFSQNTIKEKPSILLNISNLAWFGNTNALNYHLKASRMRSLETGRPMLRATNTGITALIDHKGKVLQKLNPTEKNILIVKVQGTSGQTIYNFIGDNLILIFSLVVLALNFFSQKIGFSKSSEKKLDNK